MAEMQLVGCWLSGIVGTSPFVPRSSPTPFPLQSALPVLISTAFKNRSGGMCPAASPRVKTSEDGGLRLPSMAKRCRKATMGLHELSTHKCPQVEGLKCKKLKRGSEPCDKTTYRRLHVSTSAVVISLQQNLIETGRQGESPQRALFRTVQNSCATFAISPLLAGRESTSLDDRKSWMPFSNAFGTFKYMATVQSGDEGPRSGCVARFGYKEACNSSL